MAAPAGGSPAKSATANGQRLLIVSAVIFVIAQALVAGFGFAGMATANVARAYIAGEAQYSKAHKEAVIALLRYAVSQSEDDYAQFGMALDVVKGDHDARMALERNPPDLAAARAGFLRGRNAPADVPALIMGFRLMRSWTPFATAVDDWRAADERFLVLEQVAERMRASPDSSLSARAASLAEIDALDRSASALERRFSNQMGAVARLAASLAYAAVAALSLVVCLGGVWLAWRVQRVWVRAAGAVAEARDRAEQASRAKGEFLANVSHEIRTPLNGVLGMVQIMRREEEDPTRRQRLDVIDDAGRALLSVLDGVLDLSKIEAGRLEVERHPFDLAETVRLATAGYAPLAEQKDIRFAVEIAPGAEGAWLGDGGKLRQVLSNLLSNALKFTASGAITLSVAETRGGLRFAVSDTGLGIAPDKQALVFEPFAQADASTTRRFGGTGLGLTICRRFVAVMGGELTLASAPGEGSTFAFDLPLARVAAPSPAAARREDLPAGSGRLRILAAEDNPTNQLILKALLEPFAVDLTVVANGGEAVEAWARTPFDLILMDAQMPVMNGPDATREIRAREALEGRPRTPVIALTANVMRHQIEAYEQAGMDSFVAKPIETSALLTAIEQALDAPGAGAAEAA